MAPPLDGATIGPSLSRHLSSDPTRTVRLTIVYDNSALREGLRADWGFSCFVEARGRRILFDTGAMGPILLENLRMLGIDAREIRHVFISHDHRDHTGGLADLLRISTPIVYVPASCREPRGASQIVRIDEPTELFEGFYSTGELAGIEQSLLVGAKGGLVVVVGCAHPGVGRILEAASRWGEVRALIGGLHGFEDFELLKDLEIVCPTHCSRFKAELESRFPEKCVSGGVGRVIEMGSTAGRRETPHAPIVDSATDRR